MIKAKLEVTNDVGLHARPAATLVKVASKYSSEITLSYGNKEANCKSILSLMSLRVKQGEFVDIEISGPDESEAIQEISYLFKNNFEIA